MCWPASPVSPRDGPMVNAHVLGMSESVKSRSEGLALRFGLVTMAASGADLAAVQMILGACKPA